MKKEIFLVVVIALAAGILIGVIVTNVKKETSSPAVTEILAPPLIVNQQQQITLLEGIVVREPANRNAWIRLGHNFFDSDQPLKAIEAYARALELNGNDPNILTDQGIMYRQVGWYDKAIGNFEKASNLDRNHQQSLYNMGIVYRYDLMDFAKAAEVWQRFIAIDPGSPGANKVKAELERLQQQPLFPQ